MAATGLLALLDDIASILDDVATLSKLAAQKTMGIAGDDLAVNAEAMVGIDPSRELPIIGKVAIGSVVNKLVLIPLALLLPTSVVTPLLMLGGAFLCYEGLHKLLHEHGPEDEAHHAELVEALATGPDAVRAVENERVKAAIFTDLVLSAEIIAVALAAVVDAPLAQRAVTLLVVALGMTAFIYGVLAVLIKVDDVGLHLQQRHGVDHPTGRFGRGLVNLMPWLMRFISVVGTGAMFLVGGGIVLHGFHDAQHAVVHFIEGLTTSSALRSLLELVANFVAGLLVGAVALVVVRAVGAVWRRLRPGADAPTGH